MTAGSRRGAGPDGSGFGKRGHVRLTPPAPRRAPESPPVHEPPGGFGGAFSSIPNPVKWAGGGLAVVALVAMLGIGGGGGGFFGGLLGGLLANRLFNSASTPSTTAARPAVIPGVGVSVPSHDVARGGFGSTAADHGGAGS